MACTVLRPVNAMSLAGSVHFLHRSQNYASSSGTLRLRLVGLSVAFSSGRGEGKQSLRLKVVRESFFWKEASSSGPSAWLNSTVNNGISHMPCRRQDFGFWRAMAALNERKEERGRKDDPTYLTPTPPP
ncbi:hypothetical protein AOLI_G00159730 [Acnodon oligacanthus]